MKRKTAFIHSNDYLNYNFNDDHPFNQKRIAMTIDLLRMMNLLEDSDLVAPRMAEDEELALIHDRQYIEVVKEAGHAEQTPALAASFGIGTEDCPAFVNMHEATALAVGGTLRAAELVMAGEYQHAVNLAGGLHHGFRGRASGFCIYNDCSVAIAYLRQKYDARVLYIDTDAHHGDGVQWAFYDDPNVLTLSFHETGKYLFPGTGNITERGDGQGYGFSVNVPLDAFTEDDSWLEAYYAVLPTVARGFKPDIIVTQNGCDAHTFDPLTHLSTTMRIYQEVPRLARDLADELCDGRLIATGGGGYDIWRVVPRAWSLLWAELSGQDVPQDTRIPQTWIDKYQAESPVQLAPTMFDPEGIFPDIPRRPEITTKNKNTVEKALLYCPKG
ncbi:acetoin utilization protein AcuC [Aneurinibacillus soli]|uniref:Acetoin utilization protein AcuC n=1 Tax=Aneurinibacillus soli TaxID=1500254 RepID=A0A0U5BCI3_9BACL|nr:acetoin utilization protein AcuC [Aneurinibacillus soli]PYE59681.1 acetoin utilization protein AcuC [Aneurinibacillus soli]BAU29318.1 Acetoin utilization protein AcuC [Aneurinibacillus soli]